MVPGRRPAADEKSMRSRRAVSALVVAAAGLAVTTAVRRFAARRTAPARVRVTPAPVLPVVVGREAVILPFPRPAAAPLPAAPAAPTAPVRCGDSGGRTKAGAPCAARATAGGRCHHHRLAA
jgi:hypothetical protein